ncbi:hypothetical protein D9758_008054 [Tetrapyrgos nigripes]|uniref:Uncharacterized protein n=1 Tax=Tetrapyrgos nigripes TaxID=182062 RepID=A0A8H5D1H7_9AGAR|nr:hypothetical protein D9758_008054 [Tetrapyrgos nigripes]
MSELEQPMEELAIAEQLPKGFEKVFLYNPVTVYPISIPRRTDALVRTSLPPPHLHLGALVTLEEFVKYARHVGKLTDEDVKRHYYWPERVGRYLAKKYRLTEYLGNNLLGTSAHINRGPKNYMLTICSNFTYKTVFPIDQRDLLAEELAKYHEHFGDEIDDEDEESPMPLGQI